MSIFLMPIAYASNNEASDVEITPKISIKGSPKGKGKPAPPTATGMLGDSPPDLDHKWAVIIGISDYYGTANDIKYADDDALDMLNTLIEVYGYQRDHIKLLISDYNVNNATKSKIINAIEWLRGSEKAEDEVVFFYSGHGARGKANDGDKESIDEAIVPYECTAESLIWDGELKTLFAKFETSRIIFIFDSCYSGGMTDLKANGRIVVMASTENGLSYEGEGWQNGVFTYYFVDKGMYQGLANTHDYSEIEGNEPATIEEAFDYARANVPSVVSQTPTISDSFENDLLL
ncbi:MAG: caspase family protein [Candidatus Aenigmatarchaeota archaeon]